MRRDGSFLCVALFYPVSNFPISSHFLRQNFLSRGDFGHCFHKGAEFLAEDATHFGLYSFEIRSIGVSPPGTIEHVEPSR